MVPTRKTRLAQGNCMSNADKLDRVIRTLSARQYLIPTDFLGRRTTLLSICKYKKDADSGCLLSLAI